MSFVTTRGKDDVVAWVHGLVVEKVRRMRLLSDKK
jgi:hypothetical protein